MGTRAERPTQQLEINAGRNNDITTLKFTADGQYLVGGSTEVGVWRVQDGEKVKTMEAVGMVSCLAVSNDLKWIAAGTWKSKALVWNAKTFEKVFEHEESDIVNGVDFSPDSTRFVIASANHRVTVWDIRTDTAWSQLPLRLKHEDAVIAAKYSPQGDRIATATSRCVRFWKSSNGDLLQHIPVQVTPCRNTGLLWSNNHLFVVSGDKIKKFRASTGTLVSEFSVPSSTYFSCIALPRHGEFIAYSASHSVSFWDTTTRAHLARIEQTQGIRAFALSPDDMSLAVGGEHGRIAIQRLRSVDVGYPVRLYYSFQEPEIRIDDRVRTLWERGQLEDAEKLLSAQVSDSHDQRHHALSCRALIRTRLDKWADAVRDAEKSINIQPSVIGYIAKSVALAGKNEKIEAYRACDIAFEHHYSTHISFLLLIKAIIVFMSGEHDDALSRLDDLIATFHSHPVCVIVQAYMLVLVGRSRMDKKHYKDALEFFKRAEARFNNYLGGPLLVISLMFNWTFDRLGIMIQQGLCEAHCEALLDAGFIERAGEAVFQIPNAFYVGDHFTKWISDFRGRCYERLEQLGDVAMTTKKHDDAISRYSIALSITTLSPASHFPSRKELLVKRSKAYVAKESWRDALNDADEIILLDSSFVPGHERKYAALHGAKHYAKILEAFETLLSKMSKSSDADVRSRFDRCMATKKIIRETVQHVIQELPRVLINTAEGRLYDKSRQATAFESTPFFTELVLSMASDIDKGRIKREVTEFYQYATFSHTWEDNEPLFKHVKGNVVYQLAESPTHRKLQMFCKIARDAGFKWAWSDTCCIDQGDPSVLHEAIIAMFRWYESSALTIVVLRGVSSPARCGDLVRSVWNSRSWTFQEYHASKVVRFYTEDWKLYRDIGIPNHKAAPEIISEMEAATGISARTLSALRPGLHGIRVKLRLASERKTTRVEDAAYSLLGMFSITLPIMYGDRDRALGRLLAQLISSSGDTSILAWTGESGGFNSCLPARISVFKEFPTTHIPLAINDTAMDASLPSSSNSTLVMQLYDRLAGLRVPAFAGQRMRLPCLIFELRSVLAVRNMPPYVFRAQSDVFRFVEIQTTQKLSLSDSLYVVHPWIDFLLDRRPGESVEPVQPEVFDRHLPSSVLSTNVYITTAPISSRAPRLRRRTDSPSRVLQDDKQTQARKMITRLMQPFGALLFTRDPGGVAALRRVATESLIRVQVTSEMTPFLLNKLIEGVRTVDVL